jgi:transposase InsO family protein
VATVSGGGTSERFGFIDRYKDTFGVTALCEWLGVSRSGYYAWSDRAASSRCIEDQELTKLIQTIFTESEERYGSPRIHKALEKQGYSVGKKRVERLMREAGLVARVCKVTRRHVGVTRFYAKSENKLLDVKEVETLNTVWVTDVTFIRYKGQWQYLATVMDRCSRRIIGWSLATRRNMSLTVNALRYALRARNYPKGVIVHSDRGVEFTGHEFQTLLKKHGLEHSANRAGCCTDNAHMESFYHSLKTELIRGSVFGSLKELRSAIGQYINRFYNTVRLHSGIDYQSPIEYEERLVCN